MRKKAIMGWILFLLGVSLQVISDVTDIWIIGFVGGIIWPIGTLIGVKASTAIVAKKQSKESSGENE